MENGEKDDIIHNNDNIIQKRYDFNMSKILDGCATRILDKKCYINNFIESNSFER